MFDSDYQEVIDEIINVADKMCRKQNIKPTNLNKYMFLKDVLLAMDGVWDEDDPQIIATKDAMLTLIEKEVDDMQAYLK